MYHISLSISKPFVILLPALFCPLATSLPFLLILPKSSWLASVYYLAAKNWKIPQKQQTNKQSSFAPYHSVHLHFITLVWSHLQKLYKLETCFICQFLCFLVTPLHLLSISLSPSPDHLLSDTFPGQDCDSPDVSRLHNNNLPPQRSCLPVTKPNPSNQSNPSAHLQSQPQTNTVQAQASFGASKRRLSAERSLSTENPPSARGPEGGAAVKPARVYTITQEGGGMTLGGRGSEESLELEVLKGSREQPLSQAPDNNPSCTSQPSAAVSRGSHHRSSHNRSNHHHAHQHHGGTASSSQPLQSSGSANNIRDWGLRKGGSRDDYTPDCVACIRAPCQSQRSLDLDTSPRDGGKHRKKLERMYSEDRASTDDRGIE